MTRFNNYDAGTRPFSTTLTQQGAQLTVTGWIDYVAHVGYAAVTGAFHPQAMVWSDSTVGIIPQTPDHNGNPILPMPAADADWHSRPLDPTTSRLDAMLAVLSSLGSDRPDNPLLVQQTGALWLRDDTVDSTPVSVFAAPPTDKPSDASSAPITAETSSLRLWVDDTGLMRRAEVRLGDDWTTADMPDGAGPALALPEGAQ
ncbi:hypothetical protein [Microbacterium deminutum]|uniref:hypothetical protein n=1 Tax=Microbacterium deminutum TaxID=344164 RepID=UPI0031E40121